MEVTQRPELKTRVVLSPQVYQGLSILAMPLADLEQLVEQELVENPVLETEEMSDDADDELPTTEEHVESNAEEQQAWEDWLDRYEELDSSEPIVPRDPEPDDTNTEEFVGGAVTFAEHLYSQLGLLALAPEVEAAAKAVVGLLDEDGFFKGTLEDAAKISGVSISAAESGLAAVKQLDPLGVGAADVREALLIQAHALGIADDVVTRIIEEFLPDVAAGKFREIASSLGVGEKTVVAAVEAIRVLNPRPAGAFSEGFAPPYVVPDVTLRREGGEWLIIPNNESLPVLRISKTYRDLLRDGSGADEETKAYVKERVRSAENFIHNIERRKDTVSRIAEMILETQSDFFEDGRGDLRPLKLEDVAAELGVHLSTVSRGVNGKYMATPYGLFELKYFFSGGYRTSDGFDVAATTIKSRIRELIDSEDPAKPLSDQRIAEALAEQGVEVARRTIAKYREEMGIEPSWARRRKKAADVR